MKVFNMFITAVCVIFLIKLRWLKTKSLYDTVEHYFDDIASKNSKVHLEDMF